MTLDTAMPQIAEEEEAEAAFEAGFAPYFERQKEAEKQAEQAERRDRIRFRWWLLSFMKRKRLSRPRKLP